MCQTAVWRSQHDLTEIYVTGRRQHIDSPLTVTHIRTTGNRILIEGEDLLHNRIGVIIIISVLRRLAGYQIENAHMLFSFKVILQCLHQLTHCKVLFVIHIVFNCR